MQTLDQIVYQQADKKNPDVALQIDQLCIKNLQRKGVLPLDYKSSKYLLIASAGKKIIGFATLTDYGSERFYIWA